MSASEALSPGQFPEHGPHSFDALSGRQFFHGTTADLQPGDELQPGSKVGKGKGRSVWLASHPDSARGWAQSRAARDGHTEPDPNDPTGWATRSTVPVHVYEVSPTDHSVDRNGHHRAKSARVVRKVE